MPFDTTNQPVLLEPERYRVALEPAHNNLYSLMMLNHVEGMPGASEWISRTAAQLSPELLHRNRLVIEGLFYAVLPDQSHPSFMAYLSTMAATDPVALRDRLLEGLWRKRSPAPEQDGRFQRPHALLRSVDEYIEFLTTYFASSKFDVELEQEVFPYLINPPRLKAIVIEHLREMWHAYLAAEWECRRPLLLDTVAAFQRLSLRDLEPAAAIRAVIGRDLDEKMECWSRSGRIERIAFVPSSHVGPYLGKFDTVGCLYIIFSPRQPSGIVEAGSTLSRSELLVQLGALDDDTRLQVLALLSHHEELCAPELVERLDLSQSAVSRHLRQLVATGFVSERWRDGSKCYQINRERLRYTLRGLEHFFS